MAIPRRPLDSTEQKNLDRLKAIWILKKHELGLTQDAVAIACGWSGQTAFSQYLNANTPLNIEAVLKLSKVLKVHPTEIMPDLADLLPCDLCTKGKRSE